MSFLRTIVFALFIYHKASLTYACGEDLIAASGDLILTSPNYPQPHENNLNCTWVIRSSIGANVKFTLTDLDTESCCDYLEIIDAGIRIAHLQGTVDQSVPLVSSSTELIVRFISDGNVANSGFRATYKEVRNCGNHLFASNEVGYFSTPLYPEFHPPDLDCFWSLRSRNELKQVEVIFREGFTESCCDYVEVYDGSNFLERIKGNITRERKFSSMNNILNVYFHSVAQTTRTGFLASYKDAECGGLFRLADDSLKVLSSPNYPSLAAHNLDCSYTLTAEPGYRIELTLEVDTESCCDYLDLYEGRTSLGKLKGYVPKSTIISLGRSLNIRFHTDHHIESKGFIGYYRQILPSCGKALKAKTITQNLTSPGYPASYPENYRCSWLITAPRNWQIALKISDLLTEECCDNVEIFDGLQSVGQLQGKVLEPITILSNKTRLAIRFNSDSKIEKRGFSTTYKLVQNCGSDTNADPYFIKSISTPNYPSNYPDSSDCMWTLRSKAFYQVELNITSGELETAFDYVQILDGLRLIETLDGRWSTTKRFVSESNTMRVYFHSDSRATRGGFRATYRQICDYNYNVTENEQFLMSPNYPHESPLEYLCTYHFKAPRNRRIAINVLNVSTEACCDLVKIYDGESLLSTLSGTIAEPQTFLSTGEEMKIHYTTDSALPSVGFQLTYRLIN